MAGLRLEVRCLVCAKSAFVPIAMLRRERGDRSFRAVLQALRCSSCQRPSAPVFLLAGEHREHCGGAPPDWAIELRAATR